MLGDHVSQKGKNKMIFLFLHSACEPVPEPHPPPQVPSLKFLSREATWETLDSMPRVKEGLEYYHSLYSPYNRTMQARLFANIR